MEKPVIRISVRNLVEFILRNGDLESGGTAGDKEAMLKGSRPYFTGRLPLFFFTRPRKRFQPLSGSCSTVPPQSEYFLLRWRKIRTEDSGRAD